MIFQGKSLSIKQLEEGFVELCFDSHGESVNKFDTKTIDELSDALSVLEGTSNLQGVMVTSAKPMFIVGADITEFVPLFDLGADAVINHLAKNNKNNRRLESLPCPVVVAINGFALGGGLEFCLACDFRVMSVNAAIGLPEVNLGLYPGWGGTARLPRIAGANVAVEWICTGAPQNASKSLEMGVVDEVAEPEQLRKSALSFLQKCSAGTLDYQRVRQDKMAPLTLSDSEKKAIFVESKIAQKAKATAQNTPAASITIDCILEASGMGLYDAIEVEAKGFAKLFKTDSAKALVGNFLSDQLLNKKSREWAKRSDKQIEKGAVLGAGIMGGGIAYQSALRGVPVLMKDIAQAGLDLGIKEAAGLLNKRVSRGQMTEDKMAQILSNIKPTLSYDGFDQVDVVVEAVVENPKIKKIVLAEVEKSISSDAVLTSNTSTISISFIAEALARPENFCGMHFFNPVHAMPLVEVIRGEKSSDTTIARTVAYANAMGKKVVVVNDCPGFLVNRTLFPYFAGFAQLVQDGADIQEIDKVMESWGWPMGPAYLMDVVGIDTCVHCEAVMADSFDDGRMRKNGKYPSDIMADAGRFGQKSGKGFYDYVKGEKGGLQKQVSLESYRLLGFEPGSTKSFSPEEIFARCMLPMAIEMARCLEEGIVGTPAEADMALIYGLGFPAFRGGVFRWMDSIGLPSLVEMSDRYAHLGKLYQVTKNQRDMASTAKRYY